MYDTKKSLTNSHWQFLDTALNSFRVSATNRSSVKEEEVPLKHPKEVPLLCHNFEMKNRAKIAFMSCRKTTTESWELKESKKTEEKSTGAKLRCEGLKLVDNILFSITEIVTVRFQSAGQQHHQQGAAVTMCLMLIQIKIFLIS